MAKLNAAGSALVYSTYLGGSDDDTANVGGTPHEPLSDAHQLADSTGVDRVGARAILPGDLPHSGVDTDEAKGIRQRIVRHFQFYIRQYGDYAQHRLFGCGCPKLGFRK